MRELHNTRTNYNPSLAKWPTPPHPFPHPCNAACHKDVTRTPGQQHSGNRQIAEVFALRSWFVELSTHHIRVPANFGRVLS